VRFGLLPLLLLFGCVGQIPYAGGGDDPGLTINDDDDDSADDDDDSLDDDDAVNDDDDSADDDDTALNDDDAVNDDDVLDDDDAVDDDDFTPPDPGACPCDFGRLCVLGQCQWADTFAVGLLETETPAFIASGSGCFYTSTFLGGPLVALTGPCEVSVLDPNNLPTRFYSGDAGAITVTGGALDPVGFAAPAPAECLPNNILPTSDLFSPGQNVRFLSTGGSDVPAFDETLTAPASIVGAPGGFSIGADLTVAWNAGTSDHVEVVLAASNLSDDHEWAIRCRVADVGGFTVPASLTSYLPSNNDGVTLTLSRTGSAHLEFPTSGVVVEAALQSAWSTDL
jgi:hypothetical protein